MIRKSKVGLAADYELVINDVPVLYQNINGLKLSLTENQHDMLVIEVAGISPTAVTEYINAPVYCRISTGSGYSHDFYGYIVRPNPVAKTQKGLIEGSPFQVTELVALGVSYMMRGLRSADWDSSSLVEVTTALARRYNLSADVPNVPRIPTPQQANESDWQYLVRFADMHGLHVTCHGTHLHVFSPHEANGRQASVHRLLSPNNTDRSGVLVPGAIIDFEPVFAERHPDGEYMNTVVTVAYPDGTTFDVTSAEVLGVSGDARFTHRIEEIADNYAEAVRMVMAVGVDVYDWTADVTVGGLAGCVPGGVVDLYQYGGDFDGLWYVRSVEHVISSERFITHLDIARNKNNELNNRSFVPRLRTYPNTVFDGTRFRSERRYVNAY